MDSVYFPIMDVEGALREIFLPGIKALQVAFIVPNKPVPTRCTLTHSKCR